MDEWDVALGPVVRRLVDAVNAHDLDAIVTCFAEDYRNETPAHPRRRFSGREQVRRNWAQILGAVPTVSATVRAAAARGDAVWSEWELAGIRRDGAAFVMRGVIIFTVAHDQIRAARFYLEPLDEGLPGYDQVVAEQTGGAVSRRAMPCTP